MKKRLKAFTLIECIVALTIFAVTSLSIATVYANIAQIKKQNEYMQYSLATQMKYVEQRVIAEGGEAIGIIYDAEANESGLAATGAVDIGNNNVMYFWGGVEATYAYAYGVNIYVLYSRDINDQGTGATGSNAYGAESNSNLRYKYILPATPYAGNSANPGG